MSVQPLSDRAVRRGLRLNILAGSLGMGWFAVVFNMPYIMLLEALGAGGLAIGAATSIRQLGTLAQIPGSLVMEGLKRRKPLWAVLMLVQRALWFIPAVIVLRSPTPPWAATLVVGVAAAGAIVDQFASSAWHGWMADLVPERIRGRFWSTRQIFVMAAFLLTIWASGRVLDLFARENSTASFAGFAIVFACAAVLGITDILVHLAVPEPSPGMPTAHHSVWRRLRLPLQHPSFRNLTLSIGVWSFACTMAGTFNVVYLRRAFGASYSDLAMVATAGSISTLLFALGARELIDRIGARSFGVVMMVVAPLFGTFWFFCTGRPVRIDLPWLGAIESTQAVLLISASSLVAGGVYSGVGLSHLSLLALLSPRRGRATAMALHWTCIGLIGAGGALVGGKIVDYFAAHPSSWRLFGDTRFDFIHVLALLHALIIWLGATPLLLRVRARRETLNVTEAFNRMLMVNPVRFISSLYHVRNLSAPATRRRRTRSISVLGTDDRSGISVQDMIGRLCDPSHEVREAAVRSLGHMTTISARNALLRTLSDPDADLALPIVRALRGQRDPRVRDALLDCLDNRNMELTREAVRALGTLGDRTVKAPLLELLVNTPHNAIACAAAEALARLDATDAVSAIEKRLSDTRNQTARRTLALAIGDLIGPSDRFYRLLCAEDIAYGSEVIESLLRAQQRLRGAKRGLSAALSKTAAAYERGDYTACLASAADCARQVLLHESDKAAQNELFLVIVALIQGLCSKYTRVSGDTQPTKPDRIDLVLTVFALLTLLNQKGDAKPRRTTEKTANENVSR